jgi:hypothetical protein
MVGSKNRNLEEPSTSGYTAIVQELFVGELSMTRMRLDTDAAKISLLLGKTGLLHIGAVIDGRTLCFACFGSTNSLAFHPT